MEPSSSPAPGASPDAPLWTSTAAGRAERLAGVLDLAFKIVMAAYTLMAAWQVAKALNPPLKVHQDLAVAAVRRYLGRDRSEPPGPPPADVRDIYDDTR